MPFDLSPPPKLWLPKPAIVRPLQREPVAMASFLPGMFPAGVLAQAIPSISYRTSVTITTNLSTYTFSNQDIGDAKHTRRVVVAVAYRRVDATSSTITSVTVGGITAAQVVTEPNNQETAFNRVSIYRANVPSGTTADIVVTMSLGALQCAIGVWAVYDLNSDTAVATASASSDTSVVLNLNVPRRGVVVGACMANGTPAIGWTGLSERFEIVQETDIEFSGADTTSVAGSTPLAVTATITSGAGIGLGCAASWR